MAIYAKTHTTAATAADYTPPGAAPVESHPIIRIENLDSSINVWVCVLYGGTAAVEGDESVRLIPGQSLYFRYLPAYSIIAASGTPKVLMEGNNGRVA